MNGKIVLSFLAGFVLAACATHDVNTGLATDIPERGWYEEKNGKDTFPILFGAIFAITSDSVAEQTISTR